MRYFIGFLVMLGLIIFVIFLIFHGGGKPKTKVIAKPLASYASTRSEVSMTTDGPVNADSLHQQIRITVDRETVRFDQIQGYNAAVVNSTRYNNTENAYATFLVSLQRAGFRAGDKNPLLRDERGICALGDRYIFEINQDGKQIQRYWATSCGKTKTYLGALSLTLDLFRAQVPDYDKLVERLKL